jgi:hypothetical protein
MPDLDLTTENPPGARAELVLTVHPLAIRFSGDHRPHPAVAGLVATFAALAAAVATAVATFATQSRAVALVGFATSLVLAGLAVIYAVRDHPGPRVPRPRGRAAARHRDRGH